MRLIYDHVPLSWIMKPSPSRARHLHVILKSTFCPHSTILDALRRTKVTSWVLNPFPLEDALVVLSRLWHVAASLTSFSYALKSTRCILIWGSRKIWRYRTYDRSSYSKSHSYVYSPIYVCGPVFAFQALKWVVDIYQSCTL